MNIREVSKAYINIRRSTTTILALCSGKVYENFATCTTGEEEGRQGALVQPQLAAVWDSCASEGRNSRENERSFPSYLARVCGEVRRGWS
jgi:hypothetical protein